MFCPHCGAEEAEGASFCAKCGTSLALTPASGAVRGTVQTDDRIRGRSGVTKFAAGKNPAIAAILSLILPGLAIGQFYNGDTKKGLLMLAGSVIAIPLWFTGGLGSILDFGIWAWSVVDAYRVASGTAPLW